ncbi:Conserved_hypothetical protein [Hexamita inflata]|uniref:Uncharacterized protein n=1 Tax=Hexamita inflata TaxID=28002 RepID=A0AA86NTC9_9EUKA|nr:Conserved hypothetical protein [Hexamita inflata]
MIPVDTLLVPLKALRLQMLIDIQRVQGLINKRNNGTLQEDDIDKVKSAFIESSSNRQSLVAPISNIFSKLENVQVDEQTDLISKIASTPLNYQYSLVQSNASVQLLPSVVQQFYYARYPICPRNPIDSLNLHGVYKFLHQILTEFPSSQKTLYFVLKQFLSEDDLRYVQDLQLMCYTENFTLEHLKQLERPRAVQFIHQLAQNTRFDPSHFKNEIVNLYEKYLFACPGFYTKIVKNGLKCYKTHFCSVHKQEVDPLFEAVCPTCAYQQIMSSTILKTNLRCGNGHILNFDDKMWIGNGELWCNACKEAGFERIVFPWG